RAVRSDALTIVRRPCGLSAYQRRRLALSNRAERGFLVTVGGRSPPGNGKKAGLRLRDPPSLRERSAARDGLVARDQRRACWFSGAIEIRTVSPELPGKPV